MGKYKDEDLVCLRSAGKAAGTLLWELSQKLSPGISTLYLDEYAAKIMKKMNVRSAPKMFEGFPGNICVNTNDVIAHGIPGLEILEEGDRVNIDVAIEKNGFFADVGYTFLLGDADDLSQKVVKCARESLEKAIAVCLPGVAVNRIGKTIYKHAKRSGLTVVKNLCSHGIGKALHEHPVNIFNYANEEQAEELEEGMVLAIEPFISSGATRAVDAGDGWSLTTHDKSIVAQFEHTILITNNGAEILTAI